MKGTLIKIPADGGPLEYTEVKKTDLDQLQAGVGGSIEEVPYWKKFHDPTTGTVVNAVIWCNEEGKLDNLPVNRRATEWWHLALKEHGMPPFDILHGDVLVCTGDKKFLDSL